LRGSGTPQQVIERLDGAVPLAVNPIVTELPGEMLPLYGSLATVTFAPDWVNTPLQSLLSCWPLRDAQLTAQLLVAPRPAPGRGN
jgi:hypothetical protein